MNSTTENKPGSAVPFVPGYNPAWILYIAEHDRWPAVWEFTQWHSAKQREFAEHLGVGGSKKKEKVESHEALLDHYRWNRRAMNEALYAWLGSKVARGRSAESIKAQVEAVIQAREQSLKEEQ